MGGGGGGIRMTPRSQADRGTKIYGIVTVIAWEGLAWGGEAKYYIMGPKIPVPKH